MASGPLTLRCCGDRYGEMEISFELCGSYWLLGFNQLGFGIFLLELVLAPLIVSDTMLSLLEFRTKCLCGVAGVCGVSS